ncbi:MAG: hypothetical protein ACHQ53_06835 [Polyangiales bacterium]
MTSRPAPPGSLEDDPLERPTSGRSQPPEGHGDYDARTPMERILPELLRRGLEAGRGPLERVSESIFPKDIAAQVVSQLGDMRSGLVKAVAQEVGRFLREADIASEVRKVLVGLDIEAQVKLRFKAREDGKLKPELEVDLGNPEAPGERRKRR